MTDRSSVTRRDAVGLAGLVAAGVVTSWAARPAGAIEASDLKNIDVQAAAPVTTELVDGVSAWKTAPEEINDFVAEYDFDVVVVGHGYAGTCACRELAEEGKKVALVEVQQQESFMAVGNESCSINSELMDAVNCPHVDPVEYYQNWQAMQMNYPNAGLIMKFAKNMGTAADWYYSVLSADEKATMTTSGYAQDNEEHRLAGVGPFKFYPGTATFNNDEVNQTKILTYNQQVAEKCGAEFFFGTEAQYVIMEDGAVAGLVATGAEGAVKFNCKAAVVATGGFSNNPEMVRDLCPDLWSYLVDGESTTTMVVNAKGRGIQMAYWAGARLEGQPVATMNAKFMMPPFLSIMPQAAWLNTQGKRFTDEYYPGVEHRCMPNVFEGRGDVYVVFDSDFVEYHQYYLPSHGVWTPTKENVAALQEQMDTAYAIFKGTAGEGAQSDYIADDTLEGLAAQLGLEGEVADNFVRSVQTYNGYCDAGVDEEFGRYPEVLYPVKKAPYYVQVVSGLSLGNIMCTCGGVVTDADQCALDKDYKPIPGLYVSGNDCGRRFNIEYVSPTPGVSLGLGITLGRECGKSVAAFLDSLAASE